MSDTAKFQAAWDTLDLRTLAPLPRNSEVESDNKDEHPFSYCMAHVVPAIEKQNGAMDDPKAFCGWWKSERAAQDKLRAAHEHPRQVHLRGAIGQLRTAKYDGKEYLVAPVVALMEGIIHAVNAPEPEFVPLTTLMVAPQGWNNRPCVLGHPVKDGRQISANSPEVLERQAFGTIFNARVLGKKLLMDAWIDPARAEAVGAGDVVTRLRAGQVCEVSVGTFVTTDRMAGSHNGVDYSVRWRDLVPDHLAFLPKGIGACSIEMGCGSPRAAQAYQVTDAELVTLATPPWLKKDDGVDTEADEYNADDHENEADALTKKAKDAEKSGKTADAKAYRKQAKDHRDKADDMRNAQYGDTREQASSEEAAELIAYRTMRTLTDQAEQTISSLSDVVDDLLADEVENPTVTPEQEEAEEEVEKARLESIQVLCMSTYSTLNALMSLCSTCLMPDYSGGVDVAKSVSVAPTAPPRYMAGARHSSMDRKIIQGVHDHAVALGAECSPTESRAAARQEEDMACTCGNKGAHTMTKDEKATLIKTLIADPHSGFATGDEKLLEAASDERLIGFRDASAARKTAAEEVTALKAAAAKPPEQKPLTEEDFRKLAPESIKALISRQEAQDAAHKENLVASLKAAQSEYTEDELKGMQIEALERLSRVVVKSVPEAPAVTYAGRAIPRVAAAKPKHQDEVFTNPPNPYDEPLKALRAAQAEGKPTIQ